MQGVNPLVKIIFFKNKPTFLQNTIWRRDAMTQPETQLDELTSLKIQKVAPVYSYQEFHSWSDIEVDNPQSIGRNVLLCDKYMFGYLQFAHICFCSSVQFL